MSSEHIGEWHPVTVTDITPEGDTEIDLEHEVTHLETCPTETGDDFSGNAWTWFVCDLGSEITAGGYEGFGITEPGTYRARFRLSCDYFGEWDGEVEVETVGGLVKPTGADAPSSTLGEGYDHCTCGHMRHWHRDADGCCLFLSSDEADERFACNCEAFTLNERSIW